MGEGKNGERQLYRLIDNQEKEQNILEEQEKTVDEDKS